MVKILKQKRPGKVGRYLKKMLLFLFNGMQLMLRLDGLRSLHITVDGYNIKYCWCSADNALVKLIFRDFDRNGCIRYAGNWSGDGCAIGHALHAQPLVLFSLAGVGIAANSLGGAGGPLAV